ncbi:phosphatase PAP2 family protein [Patescibacteria group bacterium]
MINLFNHWRFYYLFIVILMVAWSRIILKKHTLSQVLEGFIIPWVMIPLGFLWLGI